MMPPPSARRTRVRSAQGPPGRPAGSAGPCVRARGFGFPSFARVRLFHALVRQPARLRILWNASASSSGLCTGFPTPRHVGRPADTADWMGMCTDGWIHVSRDERWLETSVTKILALHAPSQASRPSQPDRGVAPSTVLEAFAAGPEDVVLRRLLSAPHWRVGEFGREFEGPSSACTTHICSGTCPSLRRDLPTSAPGPAHVCTGPARICIGTCPHRLRDLRQLRPAWVCAPAGDAAGTTLREGAQGMFALVMQPIHASLNFTELQRCGCASKEGAQGVLNKFSQRVVWAYSKRCTCR